MIDVVLNAFPWFCARKYEAEVVEKELFWLCQYAVLVVEKKLFCDCQNAAEVVENEDVTYPCEFPQAFADEVLKAIP